MFKRISNIIFQHLRFTEALLSESKGYADILVRKATEYLLASGRIVAMNEEIKEELEAIEKMIEEIEAKLEEMESKDKMENEPN